MKIEKSGLRKLLRGPNVIPSLGVHDVFSALVAERAGIPLLFVGGFGASASRLGLPDLNFITLTEMSDLVRRMTQRVSIPIVVDGDTGHGGGSNIARAIQDWESAGAAGVILEDQLSPKRCGHFMGKDIVPIEVMKERLSAALSARKNKDFVIIARTDARAKKGINEAIKRANIYKKFGVDVTFVEAPESREEAQQIKKKVKGPMLFNMLTGGKTPFLTIQEVEKMGYKIAVYPVESLMMLQKGISDLVQEIKVEGHLNRIKSSMTSFDDLKMVLGLDRFVEDSKIIAKK